MQLEIIGQEISIIYQIGGIILGFFLIIGAIFYFGTFSNKGEFYELKSYEFKMLLLFFGTFNFMFLLFIIIGVFISNNFEGYSVYSLNSIIILFVTVMSILYISLLNRKRLFVKSKRIRTIISIIIFYLISLLLIRYSLHKPLIQYSILLLLLISFLYYILDIGIYAGKKSIENSSKVTVIATNGEVIENLKLYQTTNADYRFIRNKGEDNEEEIIIPIDKVIRIITEKVKK